LAFLEVGRLRGVQYTVVEPLLQVVHVAWDSVAASCCVLIHPRRRIFGRASRAL